MSSSNWVGFFEIDSRIFDVQNYFFSLDKKEHSDEGRIIIAEYEKFFLINSCKKFKMKSKHQLS